MRPSPFHSHIYGVFTVILRSVIQEGICLTNLVTAFSIFILTHPLDVVWPDDPTNFGLIDIFCIEYAYFEEQVSFCLVLFMHTHIQKNQKSVARCGQDTTHYACLSGIKRKEEGRGKKMK